MDIKRSSDHSKKPKVLVTGASGHLGYNICKQLWDEKNFYIRAGLRAKNDRVAEVSHEISYFDVRNYQDFYKAAKDVDYIIHLAASFDHSSKNEKATIETSKIGSENLIKISQKIQFKKIIYTSSVAVCGVNKTTELMSESSNNITDLDLTDPYINAKVISHNLIYNAMKEYNLPILILMPSAIIGIDDYKKTPSNLLINKFMSYPLNKFYINAGLNIINVRDVANAHCAGLSNSAISDQYIISGYNITIKDLVSLINKTRSIKKKLFLLPKNLILIASMLSLPFVKIFKISLPVSFFQINNRLNTFGFFDNSKFINKWNIKLKSLESTVAETISWLEKQ